MRGFRPRTGDYFLSMELMEHNTIPLIGSFRPRTGDYFFIGQYIKTATLKNITEFPSPYWGLFFYRRKLF